MKIRKFFLPCLLIVFNSAAAYGAELFQQHQQLDISGSASDIAVGDIDLDGDPDIAVASNGVSIYINKTPGKYEKRERIPLNNDNVNQVELADLDLDGNLDLIAARNGSPIEIFWNDGTGEFEKESYIFSAEYSAPEQMFVIDVNNDGAADIITTNLNRKPKLFLNNGDGHFPASSKPLLNSKDEDKLALTDINRDGNLDIISLGDDEVVRFHLGNGNAEFEHKQPSDIQGDNLMDFVVGDINKDDRDDLLLVELDKISLMMNSPSGEMIAKTLNLGIPSIEISEIKTVDVNNDGHQDLILTSRKAKNILYLNNGNEKFTQSTAPLDGKDKYVSKITVLDIDGDRDTDILFSSRQLNFFSNTENHPDPALKTSSNSPQTQKQQRKTHNILSFADGVTINHQQRIKRFELSDFNGDQLADLVTLTVSGHNPVLDFFINAGDGTLKSHGTLKGPAKEEIGDIAFADIDNDGDRDLLIGWLDQYVTLHSNDGQGRFTAAGQALPKSNIRTRSLNTGYINNDAHLDIVATGQRRTQLYISTGDGRYITDHMSGLPKKAGSDVAIGDIDGDGDLDLVLSSRKLLIYNNRGNGSFNIPGTELYNPNKGAGQIFLDDIDNDGDLDLLVGDGGMHSFINEGQGTFSGRTDITALDNIAPGDLDGDGDIDAVTYRRGIQSTALFNNGSGAWVPSGRAIINGFPQILRLADFDGDADLDIIATGQYNNHLLYYENLGLKQSDTSSSRETSEQSDKNIVEKQATPDSIRQTAGFDVRNILASVPLHKAFITVALVLLVWIVFRRRYR